MVFVIRVSKSTVKYFLKFYKDIERELDLFLVTGKGYCYDRLDVVSGNFSNGFENSLVCKLDNREYVFKGKLLSALYGYFDVIDFCDRVFLDDRFLRGMSVDFLCRKYHFSRSSVYNKLNVHVGNIYGLFLEAIEG